MPKKTTTTPKAKAPPSEPVNPTTADGAPIVAESLVYYEPPPNVPPLTHDEIARAVAGENVAETRRLTDEAVALAAWLDEQEAPSVVDDNGLRPMTLTERVQAWLDKSVNTPQS